MNESLNNLCVHIREWVGDKQKIPFQAEENSAKKQTQNKKNLLWEATLSSS